jgi:PAS domain S-box-containing protein
MFFLLALGCTAWVGGGLPTLFAAILSAIIANTLFLKPGSHVDLITAMRTVWFLVSAVVIAFAGRAFARQRAALRRNNELLHAINEMAADFAYEMTVTANDVRITHLTRGAETLTGYTLEELYRPNALMQLFEPEDRRQVAQGLGERAHASKPQQGEFRLRRKDGSVAWVEYRRGPWVVERDTARVIGAARDITARKLAEDSLRHHAALLSAINSASPDLIYLKDRDGRYVYANPAYAAALGMMPADILNRRPVDILSPSTALSIAASDAEVMQTGLSHQFEESLPDAGENRVYLTSKAPWLDPSGKLLGVSGISRDITQRKALEESVRESDDRKGRFIAVLAHELRNPLAPLTAALEVLRSPNLPPHRVERLLTIMERQLSALRRLVDDMLDVTRINRGKLEIQPSWQKLEVILDTGLTACEKSLLSRGQSLSVDREQAPSDVFADPTRIAQCVTNLISNASKFAPEGSVIDIVVSSGAGFVTFAVTDEGPGVAAKDAFKVFEMFAQGQGPASSGGLGIGLSLVKQIAKAHGGDVRLVTSAPAKGACFVLELPLPEPSETDGSTVRVETPRPASGHARTVLVVDDNVDAADGVAAILELEGFQAEVHYSGEQALNALAEKPFDAAILDLGMPGMDGFELAQRIRACEATKDLRLVALSGWAQTADRAKSKAAGFDVHLAKPATVEMLLGAISRHPEADISSASQ